MTLREYHRKRDFGRTREPSGHTVKKKSAVKKKPLSFTVQEHHASHLHWDFRLEVDGVLKSWAVPKGPSMDPRHKRLAVRVEDHPLKYGTFEGRIPEGEYGAGEVILWDYGTWIPETPPRAGLREGELKFTLKGKRLKGSWALVRMKKTESDKNWLLIKHKDEHAFVPKALPLPKTARRLQLTHPDKVLWPESGLTKAHLAEYYLKAAAKMLPHIEGRPLMIQRCPVGVGGSCFFQKHWVKGMPSAIKKIRSRKDGEPLLMIDSAEGLLELAQLGVLEVHMWNTRAGHLESPDQWVFDLDPDDSVPWKRTADAALKMREILKGYGLESFLKTTGGKGLHVVVPIEAKLDWELGKELSRAFSAELVATAPDRFLLNMSKAKRKGKIFVDYLRNGRGSTAVAPYSPRSREAATLSMPISWKELQAGARSDSFHILDSDRRLSKAGADPWKKFLKTRQLPRRPAGSPQ